MADGGAGWEVECRAAGEAVSAATEATVVA